MAIDPSIALRVDPLRMESPANMLSQVMQIRAAQQQEQANALKLMQAQREQQEMDRYNALMERGGATPQELIRTAQGRASLKSIGEMYQQRMAGEKERRLGQQAEFKLGQDQVGAVRQVFSAMAGLPDSELTRDKIVGRLLSLETIGVPRSIIEATAAQVSDDPAANRREIETVLRAGMAPKDLSALTAPKLEKISIGGKDVYSDMNPNSPSFRQPMMVTPGGGFTLSPGQVRFEGGAPVASAPFAPRPEAAGGFTLSPGQVRFEGGAQVAAAPVAPVEDLSPKERQKREAALPTRRTAVKAVEQNSDSLITEMERLKNHKALSAILGPIESRLPSFFPGATNAQAILNQIKARGTFSVLQAMRDASKTGGALGNVSNLEIGKLEAAFAALDQAQSETDFKAAIDRAIAEVNAVKERMREAFEEEYEYRGGAGRGSAPSSGGGAAAPARNNDGWSVER